MPAGFLLCNGAEVSKTEYSNLYEAIEDEWGTASDSGNFKLPDMRDCFPEGAGTYGVGESVAAGVPDLVGSFHCRQTGNAGSNGFATLINDSNSTLFLRHEDTETGGTLTWTTDVSAITHEYRFTASNGSSLYTDVSTVQPQSKVFSYIIKY